MTTGSMNEPSECMWKTSQTMPQMSIFMQKGSEAESLAQIYEFHMKL